MGVSPLDEGIKLKSGSCGDLIMIVAKRPMQTTSAIKPLIARNFDLDTVWLITYPNRNTDSNSRVQLARARKRVRVVIEIMLATPAKKTELKMKILRKLFLLSSLSFSIGIAVSVNRVQPPITMRAYDDPSFGVWQVKMIT